MACERFFSNAGSRIKVNYGSVVFDDGSLHVEPVGTDDIQDSIQSYAASVDFNNVYSRFCNGDSSGFRNPSELFYGDMTEIPKNYHEFANMSLKGKLAFDRLPADVKAEYGNDYGKFINSSFEALVDRLNKAPAADKTVVDKIVDKAVVDVTEVK